MPRIWYLVFIYLFFSWSFRSQSIFNSIIFFYALNYSKCIINYLKKCCNFSNLQTFYKFLIIETLILLHFVRAWRSAWQILICKNYFRRVDLGQSWQLLRLLEIFGFRVLYLKLIQHRFYYYSGLVRLIDQETTAMEKMVC